MITGKEAERIGLVSAAVPLPKLDEEVRYRGLLLFFFPFFFSRARLLSHAASRMTIRNAMSYPRVVQEEGVGEQGL